MKRDDGDPSRGFEREVRGRERRFLASRKEGRPSVASTIGIVGWSVSLPMLAGVALGRWLDGLVGGERSFTIMLMIGGLFLGCAIAWTWVRRRTAGPGADDDDRS